MNTLSGLYQLLDYFRGAFNFPIYSSIYNLFDEARILAGSEGREGENERLLRVSEGSHMAVARKRQTDMQ